MKTNKVATGILGALAIAGAMGLTACGASDAPETIGEARAALNSTAPAVATTSLPTSLPGSQGAERIFPATCKITQPANGVNPAVDYLVMAGGFSSTPLGLNDIWVQPIGGSWTKLTPTLSASVGNLQGIAHPSDSSKCIFAGGETKPDHTGTTSKKVDILSVSNTGVFSIASATDLTTARSNFALTTCTASGTSHLVAVGGTNGATRVGSIEVADVLVPTSWTEYTNTKQKLVRDRYDFAFAKDPFGERYIVAGGNSATAANEATIEVVTMDGALVNDEWTKSDSVTCEPFVKAFTGVNDVKLSNGVQGNVGFYEGTHSTTTSTNFRIAGGMKSDRSLPTTTDEIQVTWSTPALATGTTRTSVGTYRPALVIAIPDSPNEDASMLIGGGTASTSQPHNGVDGALTNVQNYQKSFNWKTASPVMSAARFGASAQLINGFVYAVAGRSFGATDYLLTVDKITP